MSKKIAAGADAILLDVTVGEGAFMKTVDEARELAQTMVGFRKAVGRKTVAVITDMSQPLGRAIGNRLEIPEALEILQGQGRQDITHFICELAQIMLGLANVNKTVEEVRQHLENGQALAKFEEMVQAQGGDLKTSIVLSMLPMWWKSLLRKRVSFQLFQLWNLGFML